MLNLMSLMETIRMEVCSNNQQGYGVNCSAPRPYRASGSQVGEGLRLQDRPNEWGNKSTRFHRLNVVSCEIVWKVSEMGAG